MKLVADVLTEGLMGKPGPFVCRCGAEIGHPGVCDSCGAAWELEAFQRLLAPARGTIPARFRWARFGAPEMRQRVPEANMRRVLDIASPLPLGIALVGESGAGKTSLACAMLQRIHDWAGPNKPHAGVERARRAFFVSAGELVAAGEEAKRYNAVESDILKRAKHASVLVLDNVEPGKLDSIVGRVVMDRHDSELVTIITTWMDEAEAGRHYGGGWARRAYGVTVRLDTGAAASARVAS